MSQAICPGSSEPFLESPDHFSLSMAVILLILSPINDPFRPVKLPNALHLPLIPLSIVTLSIEPSIRSMAMEEIGIEVSFVVLQKLDPSVMLDHKILIFSHGFGRVLRWHPFVILLQFIIQLMLIDVFLLHEILNLQDLLGWLLLLILDGQLAVFLQSFLLVCLTDE